MIRTYRLSLFGATVAALLLLAGCGDGTDLPPVSDSWVKIDAAGQAMAAGEPDHRCVLDARTGLMWEVKHGEDGPHRPGQTYSWHAADRHANMSEPGAADAGDCVHSRCDTEGLVAMVNQAGLCGFDDWRMPTRTELMTLGDRRLMDETGLIVDAHWFPHVQAGEYWSGETFRLYPQSAWAVDMRHGLDRADHKREAKSARLVRMHQAPAGE